MGDTSQAVQWSGLGAFTAEGTDSIPVWGTKIPASLAVRAVKFGKKKKMGCREEKCPRRRCENLFYAKGKPFKKGQHTILMFK